MQERTHTIHQGLNLDGTHMAVAPPLYPTSIFNLQDTFPNTQQYSYARYANPNRDTVANAINHLEQGIHTEITASGMAAISLVTLLLKSGDHLLTSNNLYGGTFNLFHNILPNLGIEVTYLDTLNDAELINENIRPNTKLVWLETPSNPLFRLTDIQLVCDTVKNINPEIIIATDNTFMSPVCQKPLTLGCDISMNSTTKYINGHSDIIGGSVTTNNKALADKLHFLNMSYGLVGAPFDSWLILRGMKTLHIRMQQHIQNATALAEYLESNKYINQVFYPGLKSHPQHDLAKSQMLAFGGTLSFELNNKLTPEQILKQVKLHTVALSLGSVESLISQSWSMSHGLMSDEQKLSSGITPNIFRISVGIEDINDLIADLDQAFYSAASQ